MRKYRTNRGKNADRSKDISLILGTDKLKEYFTKLISELDHESIEKLIVSVLDRQRVLKKQIPLSVFDNNLFSLNESIVKYLHENLTFSFKQIGDKTAKSNKTVWQIYQNSRKKSKKSFKIKEEYLLGIPLEILDNSNHSTLEIVVSYMKDKIGMSYNNIALKLRRDYRTVWTVYQRSLKKRKDETRR